MAVTSICNCPTQAVDGKKNVLFIMADDMRPELEPFRGEWGWEEAPSDLKTPNLKDLAEQGSTFTKTFCQQAICGPSRTSLMTGRRPDTTKVYANSDYWRNTYDFTSMPQYFKENGYCLELLFFDCEHREAER